MNFLNIQNIFDKSSKEKGNILISPKFMKILEPVFGEHNVNNALFAIAVSHQLGFTAEEMKIGLKKYHRPIGRLTTYRLKEEILLINDTFNTKPCAYKAAIDVLCQISRGVSIAVLGNIRWLGRYSEEEHKDVGRHIAARNIDLLFTIGAEAKYIGEGAISAGFPPERVRHFSTKKRLIQALIKKIKPRTSILVKGFIKKGHRAMNMKDIVSYIRESKG